MDSIAATSFVMATTVALALQSAASPASYGEPQPPISLFRLRLLTANSLPTIHPCTHPCHAPSSCSEAEPCMATITLTCPCGRIRQSSPCGRGTSNPAGREGLASIKCSNECAIAKRNARLAEALGISPAGGAKATVVYSDDLHSYARANLKFLGVAEKGLAEYAIFTHALWFLAHRIS